MHYYKQGLTLVEILIALAILLIIATVSFTAFSNISKQSALKLATQDVTTTLTKARNDTFASKEDTVFGAHIDANEVTYFEGDTYVAGAPGNLVTPFEGGVYASTTAMTSPTIVFERLTGTPSATGEIVLIEPRTLASSTVTIYASGLIE